jgi:glutathione S-transferase
MKLYGDVISPFVRMCLVTAHEVGLGQKVAREEARVAPDAVNAAFAAINPIGKVPALVTDHGHALHDSRVIMEYLCHVAGDKLLIPDDGVKRFRVLTLLALGQGMGDAAVGYRYETAARPAALRWDAWAKRQAQRIDMALDELEKNWGKDLEGVSAGTIAVAVVLGYMDFRMPDWGWRTGRPGVAAFVERFAARPSMQATKLA